jgi:hypothetical protein
MSKQKSTIDALELSASELATIGGAHNHPRKLSVDRNIPAAPPFPGGFSAYYGGAAPSAPLYYGQSYGGTAQLQQYQQLAPSAAAGNHSYMPIYRV